MTWTHREGEGGGGICPPFQWCQPTEKSGGGKRVSHYVNHSNVPMKSTKSHVLIGPNPLWGGDWTTFLASTILDITQIQLSDWSKVVHSNCSSSLICSCPIGPVWAHLTTDTVLIKHCDGISPPQIHFSSSVPFHQILVCKSIWFCWLLFRGMWNKGWTNLILLQANWIAADCYFL